MRVPSRTTVDRQVRLHVLIVESNRSDAEGFILKLERAGFSIRAEIATSLQQVSGAVSRRPFDIILSDDSPAQTDALDVLALVRRLHVSAPVIVVAASMTEERAMTCMRAGVTDFVVKDELVRLPLAVRRTMEQIDALQAIARADERARAAELQARHRDSRVAQLVESEARLQKLVAASFDAIVVSLDGKIEDANRGCAELFGYESATQLIGRPAMDLVASESIEMVSQRLAVNFEGSLELVGKKRDGTRIAIESTTLIHTIDGRPGRVSAMRDVTERRRVEEKIQQAQRLESIGQLAGGIAHDFNNLLTVITNCAEMLASDLESNKAACADVHEIQQAASAGAVLARQLLVFGKQQPTQPQLVTVNDVFGQIDRMLRRLIGEHVTLEVLRPTTPIVVKVDPGQLEQVLVNLAVNARDAMPTGGRLRIETTVMDARDAAAWSHGPLPRGNLALISVSDTGMGMDEATQARMFDPFFTTKAPGLGTGLGLATVYGIVKQHGGFIDVESTPAGGTTFRIFLPIAQEAAASPGGRSRRRWQRGTESILVVEDARSVSSVVRRSLEQLGYTVIEAASPADALDIATNTTARIDLLLTDIVMPLMNGRDLAEQFIPLRPDARVLYMSGYADDALLRHGVEAANAVWLSKPFTMDDLATAVRSALDVAPEHLPSPPARRTRWLATPQGVNSIGRRQA